MYSLNYREGHSLKLILLVFLIRRKEMKGSGMTKWLILGVMLGLTMVTQAAVFSDDFETYYDPGVWTGTGDSHLNPDAWWASGNSNWGYETNNGESANDYLHLGCGTGSWQSARFGSIEDGLGFNNTNGQRYVVDVLDYAITQNNCKVRIGVIDKDSTSYWGSDNAFIFEFTNNYFVLKYKDKDYGDSHSGHGLWWGNYSGKITKVELILTSTTYQVNVEGLGGTWNVGGAPSGNHGMNYPLDQGKMILELQNWNPPSKPFYAEFDNVLSEPVPEPAAIGLFCIGAYGLLSRKK